MYVIELSLKLSPMPVAVQRKEQDAALALFAQVRQAMESGEPRLLELSCEKEEEKRIALLSSEIVAVQTYESYDTALQIANDTRYGLQAAVFTSDIAKGLQAARTLDFGGVLINEVPTWRADHMPYGGIRDSGNTREGPAYSVREMTEERLIIISG